MNDLGWSSFSEKYHLKNDRYIKDVDLLQRLQDDANYPVILYPQLLREQLSRRFIIDSSKKDKNHIYFDDLLGIAKFLELKGDEWKVLTPPEFPKMPYMPYVPMKKVEYYESRNWGCLIFLIVLAVLCTIPAFSMEPDDPSFGLILGVLWIPSILLIARMVGVGQIETKSRKRKLTQKEYKQLKDEAQEQYQWSMELYKCLKNGYEDKKIEYEQQVNSQATLLDGYLPLIVSTMFRDCLKNNSKIDDCGMPPQRGATEDKLFYALMQEVPSEIKVDKSLGSYAPDLVLFNGCSCPIDIEIDEPYEYKTKKEIHYMGCGDEERNNYFVKNNWFVLRFSENQIQNHLAECVDIVKSLASFIESGDTTKLYEVESTIAAIQEPRWTKEKSRMMAIENCRTRK